MMHDTAAQDEESVDVHMLRMLMTKMGRKLMNKIRRSLVKLQSVPLSVVKYPEKAVPN